MNGKEIIISENKLFSFVLIYTLILLLLFVPFIILFNYQYFITGFKNALKDLIFWIVPIVLFHEGFHALFLGLLSGCKFKHISFGFNKQYLSPYTHFSLPLKRNYFIAGCLAPFVLMGIVPLVISYIIEQSYWLTLGIINLWAAAGDVIVAIKLFSVDSRVLILDHPDTLGFIVIQNYPSKD